MFLASSFAQEAEDEDCFQELTILAEELAEEIRTEEEVCMKLFAFPLLPFSSLHVSCHPQFFFPELEECSEKVQRDCIHALFAPLVELVRKKIHLAEVLPDVEGVMDVLADMEIRAGGQGVVLVVAWSLPLCECLVET